MAVGGGASPHDAKIEEAATGEWNRLFSLRFPVCTHTHTISIAGSRNDATAAGRQAAFTGDGRDGREAARQGERRRDVFFIAKKVMREIFGRRTLFFCFLKSVKVCARGVLKELYE